MSLSSDRVQEIIKRVRKIEIITNRLVSSALSGSYHSSFKGRGLDFDEIREYVPGDEVRSIDWNVTAKMDKPFIKKNREERELTILLAIDISASFSFGSFEQSKREFAAEIASALAFSAIQNNDNVGLLLFTGKPELFFPPQKGRQHILRIIREILFFQPKDSGTHIPEALRYLNAILKQKSIVFLISDLLQGFDGQLPNPNDWHSDPVFQSIALANRRHDLTNIIISDPREQVLPKSGLLSLKDSETGQIIELDTHSSEVRSLYEQYNLSRIENLKSGFRRLGVGTIFLETERPYLKHLLNYFNSRKAQSH